MDYQLGQQITIAPTFGLDGARGVVRVVGVLEVHGLADSVTEPFVQRMSVADIKHFEEQTWYLFRYLLPELHAEWGFMYLPEDLLADMERAAAGGAN